MYVGPGILLPFIVWGLVALAFSAVGATLVGLWASLKSFKQNQLMFFGMGVFALSWIATFTILVVLSLAAIYIFRGALFAAWFN